jgi:AcrR family transcriptional regulator
MAATGASTRERLLDEAELLFARVGVQGATTRDIVAASGQRNASAVSYHFGSREGLLLSILARRGGPVDDRRGRCRAALGPTPSTRELVACLVRPYADLLESAGGRAYLRIVAQLRGRFAAWRVESDVATTKHLARILDELERRPAGSEAARRERLVGMIMLMTAATAERARVVDQGEVPDLGHEEFVETLGDMCASVLGT